HLSGLQKLGARLRMSEGYVEAEAERLRGAKIVLDFPSVGATQQLMMAAALAEGTTVLENAAREPENVCLARVLARMGAGVRGAGTSEVTIEGRPELGGGEHTVIPDRIEAGTFRVAAAVTGGARGGAGAPGRRHPRGRPPRHRARAAVALGRARDGDRPARQRLPRAGRARGPRHDARVARLPPGPRLRAHRGEALGARRRHRACEGAGVKAAELIVTAGSRRARARLAPLA